MTSYRPTEKRYLRPAFELRQRYHYNNQVRFPFMTTIHFARAWPQFYVAGAHIISTYSGVPYTQFVKERIWNRLNVTSSTFSPDQAALSGKLTQIWTASGRRIPFWFAEESVELNAGPGGIISSVVDMVS